MIPVVMHDGSVQLLGSNIDTERSSVRSTLVPVGSGRPDASLSRAGADPGGPLPKLEAPQQFVSA